MKISRHYPNYIDTEESNNPETVEFHEKEELLGIPFVKNWMEFGKNAHWEMCFERTSMLKENFCHLMWVSDDLRTWYVVGTIRKCSDSDVKLLKTWLPEWKYENMNVDKVEDY